MNRFVIVAALCALIASPALCALIAVPALAVEPTKKTGKDDPIAAKIELRDTLIVWTRTTVLPELRRWKNRLDGAMSADDLRQLNALRARAAEVARAQVALELSMRGAYDAGDRGAMARNRAAMDSLKKEGKNILRDLVPIAARYKETLLAIGAEAKPLGEKWKMEAKAKVATWRAAHADVELGDREMINWREMLPAEARAKVTAVRFLLWSGDDFTEAWSRMPVGTGEDDPFDIR